MLNNFKELPDNSIYELHKFNEEIVHAWVHAKSNKSFSEKGISEKFHPLLRKGVNWSKTALFIAIESIFDKVKGKKALQTRINNAFNINNNIVSLCYNVGDAPIGYAAFVKDGLSEELKTFYTKLYSATLSGSKFEKQFKTGLKKYYRALRKAKDLEVCPFCAISPFITDIENYREAFDHYFAKSVYPFNSVNPQNLFPMCYNCNSKTKGIKEVIYTKNNQGILTRRNAVYPFDETFSYPNLKIEMVLKNRSVYFGELSEEDFDIEITHVDKNKQEAIESWMEVFNIKTRFKGLIKENFSKWLTSFLKSNVEITLNLPEIDVLKNINPLSDKNFLKHAALVCYCQNERGLHTP